MSQVRAGGNYQEGEGLCLKGSKEGAFSVGDATMTQKEKKG